MAVLATASPAAAGTYVFGDSGAEQGNLYALPGLGRPNSPYYAPDGFSRESNGPVWVERLSPGIRPVLGSQLTDTSVNFAYSGATSGTDNIAADVETGLLRQIDAYADRLSAGAPHPAKDDLFLIEAGTNDFIRDLGVRNLNDTSADVVANVTNAAALLAKAGARRILVEEVPDFIHAPAFDGIVPDADRKKLEALLDDLGDRHRKAQVAALASLNASAPNADVVTVHINKLFRQILDDPAAFGFKYVDRACYDEAAAKLCSVDATVQNSYLFFDGLHLSERGQALQAEYYQALLSELDGSVNAMVGEAARMGQVQASRIVEGERAERIATFLAPEIPDEGFRLVAEANYGERRTRASWQAARSTTRPLLGKLGVGYSDGQNWTVRGALGRFQTDAQRGGETPGQKGWTASLAGERRFGSFRLGASSSWLWGDIEGQRTPMTGMKIEFHPKLEGQVSDLEAGWAFRRGDFEILPTVWGRYSRIASKRYVEAGDTGLEMEFDRMTFDRVDVGAQTTLSYAGDGPLQPRLSVSYERRVSGGGDIVGRLVENSANPIAASFDPGARSQVVIAPGLSVRFAGAARLDLSASQVVGKSDTQVIGRLSVGF